MRARSQDGNLIDRAAELVGANRSQFMPASAIREAKNVLLDQSTIYANAKAFREMMEWMDGEPSSVEREGMKRILQANVHWQSG